MQKGRSNTALVMEMIGTAFLVMAIVGSSFAISQSMEAGLDTLFLSAAVPAAILAMAIATFGPISGGHFNPAVSLGVFIAGPRMTDIRFISYAVVQIIGAIIGAIAANLMFGTEWVEMSTISREGWDMFGAELIGTFGLVYIVLTCSDQKNASVTAFSVGAFLFAAGIFTSSGAFVNPAVTIGRIFTSNASGIMHGDIWMFILAQTLGAAIAAVLYRLQRLPVS